MAALSLLLWIGCGQAKDRSGRQSSDPSTGFETVTLPEDLTDGQTDLIVEGTAGGRQEIRLDLETITRFPTESFTSPDPWTGGRHEYGGVPLYGLLDALGLPEEATTVRVIAANAYEADVRLSDLKEHQYLLATMIDGAPVAGDPSLSKRGKLFIALNLEAGGELDPEVYKHQLVWQVVRLVVY